MDRIIRRHSVAKEVFHAPKVYRAGDEEGQNLEVRVFIPKH